jgi:large subunit ribosomal protein L18
MKLKSQQQARLKRHKRVRKTISGLPERPRLSVYRSNKNIYAQVIDDVHGKTLVSASSLDKEIRAETKKSENDDRMILARKIGAFVAKRTLAKGISEVVFDRGGYLYHGLVKSLAEGAREGGLKF